MAEERVQRRLAAIFAADVVGYSQLMEADEAGTLAALKVRRKEVLEPLVTRHRGRVFKITGDGVLVEFASAVNAVQCAIDLQQAMGAANAGQPDDRQIVLRIDHYRAVALQFAVGHCLKFGLPVSRSGRRHRSGTAETRGPVRRRRQRPQDRVPTSNHGAID
jgi:class 3 adenylate cyclase